MGLLTIIRKQRRKEREMRILMLGLDNAGKTTIVRSLKGGQDLTKIMPTLGFNIDTLIHRSYSLNIWDVGGQKTLRPYWRNYFEATDAIIWVIDSTDKARLSDTCFELNSLLLEERLAGASLLVFANKHDLQGSLTVEEIEETLDLKSKPSGHRSKVIACSAITGMNVTEGLDWVVDEVASRLYSLQK
ncbi:hypothetical protein MJO28_006452 [Puccinia striiformis f. sp. tritici]|uniref:ADP-ribosylation factor-like protein 2 n=4 Tax=Puccinia striiformis TaxID=27350 RepID=A0A0L0VIJ1_9BASI|nr:hypothetical protein Pst134EA_011620 [Puccinia striiformis f. sp. tritici]KAI9605217.1 hypothetical protein H4Q26_003195 [Puccinia striiformis f. sp. tritici PST-130]KNE99105.1 ADP-ribosylation factor-like 2 [Puccinia striiformis f. sp. tritici PST-78]POW06450.1 hypothetical protein PSTT_08954 [Puccinia striiformis]KAH9456404.1 hypothetical protein Pst134EB_012601 [Puccinia striiformis f. sp. tritici]KAH9467998.1 hypothetical protein Pst134EA_011620 [Puccinia striiformis f. sp. tritici]